MKGEGGNSIPKGPAAGRSVRAKKDWMERARTCGSTRAGGAVCSPGSTCAWKSWSGEARGAPGAGGGGLDQDGALERTMTLDFRQVYLGPGQEGGECPLSLGVSQAALGPPSPQA